MININLDDYDLLPSLHLEIIDFKEHFETLDSDKLLFINDLDPILASNRNALMDCLVSRYTGDSLSVIPSCECGYLKGAYLLNQICLECYTPVMRSTEKKIESNIWMKSLEGTAGFLNPAMYLILCKLFGGRSNVVHNTTKVNVIDWLLKMPVKRVVSSGYANHPVVKKYIEYGFQPGLNSFHNQLDMFGELAFTPALFNATSNQKPKYIRDMAKQWFADNKHKLFCQFLPLPSKVTFVREDTDKVGYIDRNAQYCVDAVNTMLNLKLGESKVDHASPASVKRYNKTKEDRIALTSAQMARFYYDYISTSMSKKGGSIRKNIAGTHSNFSARGVITSNFESFEIVNNEKVWHHYQDVHLPWGISVILFGIHLANKLLKMGLTPVTICQFLNNHIDVYHPLLDVLLHQIIKEHPLGKFPILLNRNPTLLIQSIQLLYVTKIKTDPLIRSLSISLLNLPGYNADFDGDELNCLLIVDMKLYNMLKIGLSASNGILDMHIPKKIGDIMKIPRPVTSTIVHWFNEAIETVENNKQKPI